MRTSEAEIIRSTSPAVTTSKLERIFATHGIPQVVKTGNWPPFSSDVIKIYMKENGIKHQRVTPSWPQANSETENVMKPMGKAIRAAHAENKNWKRELHLLLLKIKSHTTCYNQVVTN